jgi:hypothetical protein
MLCYVHISSFKEFFMQPQYPQQQPMQPVQPPAPKPSFWQRRLLFMPMWLFIIAVCGSCSLLAIAASHNDTGSTNTGTKDNGASGQTSTSKQNQHFKVGDQVKVGSTYLVTINSFKVVTSQNQFEQPKAGNKYIAIDLTVKNTSSAEQIFSSLINCSFRDASGQQYTETFVDGYTAPDGKIESGAQIKGQLIYEVPSGTSGFTFAFVADITSSGQVIWDLTV